MSKPQCTCITFRDCGACNHTHPSIGGDQIIQIPRVPENATVPHLTGYVTQHTFEVKDSGERQKFDGGMVRDTESGKPDFTNLLHGPLLERWAMHVTKAKVKYPDVTPGVPNWTLAEGQEEYMRFKRSALRHMIQWLRGDVDEDHAAAVCFNLNGAEFVKGKLK